MDINTGLVSSIGGTGYFGAGEIVMQGGIIYAVTGGLGSANDWMIITLDTLNISNSQLILSYSYFDFFNGITASPFCKTLIGIHDFQDEVAFLNLIDGSIIPVCDLDPEGHLLASALEHAPEPDCILYLDLDCDDSSGATDADFNSPEFDCLSPGVAIADTDIKMLYDAIIIEMTIQVAGFMPNAPFEIVDMIGSVPNINITGDGTNMITLTNAGGAKSTDFKAALQQIVYKNTAEYPTAGLRTVEVQFTTESGMSSNVATAFIQVNELPLLPLDLGPDAEICEGETTTFDTGVPGATYQWSNGQMTQSITVSEAGEYIVTVSNGIECPNKDTVLLDVLPIIHVYLSGDDAICDNEAVDLTITTDAPFPIDVEITPDPGSPFTIQIINGSHSFTDLIGNNTDYVITSVVTSEPACVELTDAYQIVEVFPTYNHTAEVSICDGDSVWLGFYWETEAGVYENTLNSIDFCDSVVTTTITVLPAVNIQQQSTTCDSSEAGVFYTYLNNPNGCDTVIQTTVALLGGDTTLVFLLSCNLSNTGITIDSFSNLDGCDSLIITHTSWIPPADTTILTQTTCDSASLGIFQQILTGQSGCDSLVMTTVTMAPADTTTLFSTSCDSASLGVFQTLYSNQQGCDSLVITTVSEGIPDTTYAYTTSCDSASLGVFEEHIISQNGCDSTVFTTVAYSAQDSTFLSGTTCEPSQAGVFVQQLVNQYGCDSIITSDISLLPSDETFLSASTCDPAQAGIFVEDFINIHGCDSTVTTTVSLLPSDETFLFSTTCNSSEAGTFITAHFNQYGCDSIVTHTVSLIPADTTMIELKTCDPDEVGMEENTYLNQEGCDSLVIETTELFPLPQLEVEVTSDFNGYGISCAGASDGSASANVTGESPFTFLWSGGGADQTITGLAAGIYSVTVTDANGCSAEGEVSLDEPPAFSIELSITEPDCFDSGKGSITISQAGGIEPILYSVDGINYQDLPVFTNLAGGAYQIIAIDANDCEVKEIVLINAPLAVEVDLGDDRIIFPGDTALIDAIVNVPYDSLASVIWQGLFNPDCENCLMQIVAPVITTTYSITVSTEDGCEDDDQMTLFLAKENDVFVPNIFTPDGDGINDELIVYGGSGVEIISSFIVYDRWGNVVFEAKEFQPNDESKGWDGRFRDEVMNPGVFAYRVIVRFRDGTSQSRYGDITIVRT